MQAVFLLQIMSYSPLGIQLQSKSLFKPIKEKIIEVNTTGTRDWSRITILVTIVGPLKQRLSDFFQHVLLQKLKNFHD